MFCEIQSIGAGKDLAVAHLARSLGVDRTDVIAVGDGKGDQSMIEWAGLGVAIEGGHDDAIQSSDQLIGSPENSGLTQFLGALAAGDRFGPPNGSANLNI
jgi:hydroxymethylpyrimidine pyrophosphatase-like HAD family hydrolase